jgi:hypothetical protein
MRSSLSIVRWVRKRDALDASPVPEGLKTNPRIRSRADPMIALRFLDSDFVTPRLATELKTENHVVADLHPRHTSPYF